MGAGTGAGRDIYPNTELEEVAISWESEVGISYEKRSPPISYRAVSKIAFNYVNYNNRAFLRRAFHLQRDSRMLHTS